MIVKCPICGFVLEEKEHGEFYHPMRVCPASKKQGILPWWIQTQKCADPSPMDEQHYKSMEDLVQEIYGLPVQKELTHDSNTLPQESSLSPSTTSVSSIYKEFLYATSKTVGQ